MNFIKSDLKKDKWMLLGKLAKNGFDSWWHSFTAIDDETKEEVSFFVEYYTCNPAIAADIPTFSNNGKTKPSYIMIKAGMLGNEKMQLSKYLSYDDADFSLNVPFELKLGKQAEKPMSKRDIYPSWKFAASETYIKGSISISPDEAKKHPEWHSDNGSMAWDLQVQKVIQFNSGMNSSAASSTTGVANNYWHSEGLKTFYQGSVTANGRKYTVNPDSCFGFMDKNWGNEYASPLISVNSNDLFSNMGGFTLKYSAFAINSAFTKLYGVSHKKQLLGGLCYQGHQFDFNHAKIRDHVKTKYSVEVTENEVLWHIQQMSNLAILETEVYCEKKDMMLLDYEEPDGTIRKIWWSGNGEATVKIFKRQRLAPWGRAPLDEIKATHVCCKYGAAVK